MLSTITKRVRRTGSGTTLMWFLLALPAVAWSVVPAVKLTDSNKLVNSTAPLGGTASATFRLASAGKIRFQTSVGGLYNEQAPFDEWLEPESATEALNYEVQAVPISGTVTGPVNQWVPMGVGPRDWVQTRSADGSSQSRFIIQIRRIGTTPVLASAMVTLRATVNPPPTAAVSWLSSPGTHVTIPNFEASGAVWDPSALRLVLVSDKGDVYSSDARVRIDGDPDLEGIATDGEGLLYAGIEGAGDKPTIVELDASDFTETQMSWRLSAFPSTSSTKGMEGITWVPSGHHPYASVTPDGVFYTSSMTDGKIYIFDVDRTASGTTPTLLNPGGFTPLSGQTDISDLYYDPIQKILFVLYDGANRLVQVDISTTSPAVISDGRLPATPNNQEGVTFLPSCAPDGVTTIYLADDPTGNGYYSFNGFPGVCASDDDKAKTITQTVPSLIEAGLSYPASVTIQNTGKTTWSGSLFELAPIEGRSTSVALGASESVVPGQTKTFNVSIAGPDVGSGTASFQWRMKKEGKWFGTPTPEITVTVFDLLSPFCPDCKVP